MTKSEPSQTSNAESGVEIWAAGLPNTGSRPLTEAEFQELRTRHQQLKKRCWAWAVAVPTAYCAILAGCFYAGDKLPGNSPLQTVLAIVAILATFLGLGVGYLRIRDFGQRTRWTRRDLAAPKLDLFHGEPPEMDDETREQVAQNPVIRIAGVEARLDQPLNLEIFEISNLLWSVNGQRAQGYEVIPLERTAPLPSQAQVSAAWAPVVPLDDGHLDFREANRRELSEAEREELRRRAAKIWRRPAFPALIFTVWSSIPLFLYLLAGTPFRFSISFVLIGGAMLFWNYRLVQSVLLSRNLRADAEDGYALVVRVEQDNISIEALPNSGISWTEAGQPAGWRLDMTG